MVNSPVIQGAYAIGVGGRREHTKVITQTEISELIELYHTAQIALGETNRYDRMLWACRQFSESHPDIPRVRAYKTLEPIIRQRGAY